MIVYHANGK